MAQVNRAASPAEALIDAIGPPRDPSRTPLFQVLFSFHDSGVPDIDFGGLTGSVTERANGSAKADLNVIVVPRAAQRLGREPRPEDDDLAMIWEYSTGLFDGATIARMVEHYLTLLADAVARPTARVGQLRLMAAAERRDIAAWGTGPAVGGGAAGGLAALPDLVSRHARSAPSAIAVDDGETQLSYRELGRRAGRIAASLASRGIGPESVVAVYAGRCAHLVTGQLAALTAGAAFLPLDPGYPAQRISGLLARSRAAAVLTTSRLTGQLPGFGGHRLLLDEPAGHAQPGPGWPPAPAGPDALAYVIYTSGSTGEPKGVQVTRGGLAALAAWHHHAYQLGPGDRTTLIASPGFDASVWEIWPTLAAGGTLLVPPDDIRAVPADLVRWLARQRPQRARAAHVPDG
jgi:non-ribosomal peptide synthetase component F